MAENSLSCKLCDEKGAHVLECDWCGEGVCPDHVKHVAIRERGVDGIRTKSIRLCPDCKPKK